VTLSLSWSRGLEEDTKFVMEQARNRVKRSSTGEWRSSVDVAGDEGIGTHHHRERGQVDNGNNHPKLKHEGKEKDTGVKEKKKKSEGVVESISSLKKLNEELKEKVKKQGRAADKMAEEYSKLRGRLRKYKREREGLEAEIETLKQRNKDLAKMVGNFGNGDLLKNCQQAKSVDQGEVNTGKVGADLESNSTKRDLHQQTGKAGANLESNSTKRDPHHQPSLMAEVQKLKASMKKVFGDAVVNGTASAPNNTAASKKKSVVLKEDVKVGGMKVAKERRKEDVQLKKEETVQCKKCGKEVKQKSLIHHDRAVHLNQTRFDCNMCPYKCYFSSSLKEHKKGHDRKEGTHRSKFSCHLCTFSTPVSGSFAKHMKGHETDARQQKKQQDQN